MFCDLHVHTSDYSPCAENSAEEMCLAARDKGLDAIALTEHDVWWPGERLQGIRRRFPELVILRGMEFASPDGHFLLFAPESTEVEIPPLCRMPELEGLIHGLGGLLIWAHPFRWERNIPGWLGKTPVDGMEVASNNMDPEAQAIAWKVARETGISMFRNSDAHHWSMLGRYGNHLTVPIQGTEDLLRHVRQPA